MTCPFSTYSVDANHRVCRICPSGGSCPGDGHLYPTAGYWRPFESYDGVLECPYQLACLGHNIYRSQIGVCAEMYEGHLCQSCQSGTSRSRSNQCAKCPDPTKNKVILSFAACGVFILVGILTRSALRGAKKRANQVGVLLKIFLNYVQMMGLATKFHLHWPTELFNTFDSYESVGNSGEQLLSLNCLFPRPFFDKTLAMSLLPIVLLAINVLFWALIWTFYRLRRYPMRIQEKLICSTIVSLFYFHLPITFTALSSFDCMTLPPGDFWLRDEMAIKCWERQHLTYSLAVALPSLVLWGAGIPALALLLLVTHRKHHWESREREMMGFLYVGYKKRLYFWEVVIVLRKVLIIALHIFMSSLSATTQVFTLVLLLCVMAQLQRTFAPFLLDSLNRLELLSIISVTLTAYAGLYFSISAFAVGTQMLFVALVLLMHAFFVLYTVKIIYKVKLKRCLIRLRSRSSKISDLKINPQLIPKYKQAYFDRVLLQAQRLLNS